jgi:hypothetical protein
MEEKKTIETPTPDKKRTHMAITTSTERKKNIVLMITIKRRGKSLATYSCCITLIFLLKIYVLRICEVIS